MKDRNRKENGHHRKPEKRKGREQEQRRENKHTHTHTYIHLKTFKGTKKYTEMPIDVMKSKHHLSK